jgi:hypothetical protein
MKTKIFLAGLALLAMTTMANAQNPVGGKGCGRGPCNGTGKGASFADVNKDGVCDNQASRTGGNAGKKGNGNCNGSGQGKGQGKGKGRNFIDANGNGACDTFELRSTK